MNGTNWQFYCHGFFGETWSPGPLPGMLVDLGHKLRALALSDEKGREPLLAEAEQIKLFGKKLSLITWSSIFNRSNRSPQTGETR
jgi:N-acyl-D-aspartate/D-glutamate deacylase